MGGFGTCFDYRCEAGKGSKGVVFGRGHSGGEVGSDAAAGEIASDGVESFGGGLHDVVACAAVNMDIDVGGNEGSLGEMMGCGDALLVRSKALDLVDAPIFDGYQRTLDSPAWPYESSRPNRTDHH